MPHRSAQYDLPVDAAELYHTWRPFDSWDLSRDCKVSHAEDFIGRREQVNTYGTLKGLVRVVENNPPDDQPELDFRVNIAEVTPHRGTKVVIRVYVIRGIKLASTDRNNLSDPYVVCKFGSETQTSAVCKQTIDP